MPVTERLETQQKRKRTIRKLTERVGLLHYVHVSDIFFKVSYEGLQFDSDVGHLHKERLNYLSFIKYEDYT